MIRDPHPPSEIRLRAAIDAAPSGILMTDAEGRIVLVNRQIEELFGYPREELLGRQVEDLLPERFRGDHPALRASFQVDPRVRPMGTGRAVHGLRKDGTEVPLEIGLTPVATDSGMFVLGTVVDLSARQRAEERFRVAVESSPNGMVMIDRKGTIVLVNRQIEELFGYPRSELLGGSIDRLVPDRFREAHPAHREAFYAAPHARSMGSGRDLYGVRRDGTEIPLEIGLNPIQTEEGLFVLASVVDISARKRAEGERRRLEDQLVQAQKMEAIGRLASGIAHDFNNLLMGMIGCGELVKRSLPPSHESQKTLDDLCDAGRRGASLTRDLLNFSRRKPVDAVPNQLNAVVRVAERMLRQVIGEDVELEVELCDSGGPILANPTHVEHVLLNLAVNARDAMPRGGRLRIATGERELREPTPSRGRILPPGRYVTLEVEDTGEGMDTETQARVFEPFFTTKAAGTGTGLGLFTVHSIVDQLGGGIFLESTVGCGTRFVVQLPRHDGALPLASVAQPLGPPVAAPAASGPTRILVVEDERLIRTTLRLLLAGSGHEVLVADSGKQAAEVARACPGRIDLLLSDIVLPDTSGPEVARALAAERPGLRVLFMSAYPNDLLVRQGRVAPGTETLEKPFDEQSLTAAVRKALDLDPLGFAAAGS